MCPAEIDGVHPYLQLVAGEGVGAECAMGRDVVVPGVLGGAGVVCAAVAAAHRHL